MGNKHSRAYYKCPTCNCIDKVLHRGSVKSDDKKLYRCLRCGTIACAGKIHKLGDKTKFRSTSNTKLKG